MTYEQLQAEARQASAEKVDIVVMEAWEFQQAMIALDPEYGFFSALKRPSDRFIFMGIEFVREGF